MSAAAPPRYLVISSSFDPDSKSRRLALRGRRALVDIGVSPSWLDTSELSLPLCGGTSAADHADASRMKSAIEAADGILLGLGIYNYSAPAAAKTLVELGASAWEDKVVAFACASGGPSSYMAAMGLANSLMLDFRSVIVPRFVFATSDAFEGDGIGDADIEWRLEQVARDLVRMTAALRGNGG